MVRSRAWTDGADLARGPTSGQDWVQQSVMGARSSLLGDGPAALQWRFGLLRLGVEGRGRRRGTPASALVTGHSLASLARSGGRRRWLKSLGVSSTERPRSGSTLLAVARPVGARPVGAPPGSTPPGRASLSGALRRSAGLLRPEPRPSSSLHANRQSQLTATPWRAIANRPRGDGSSARAVASRPNQDPSLATGTGRRTHDRPGGQSLGDLLREAGGRRPVVNLGAHVASAGFAREVRGRGSLPVGR